jgi:mannose-6-phosphate isomerase-like protein (cupin superfamily)
MIIKKTQTTLEQFASGQIFDYPLPNDKIGISYQEYKGEVRVPEKGYGVNTKCLEIYYVIDGEAEVYIDQSHGKVAKGDLVILQPNQKSYLKGKSLKLLTITSPNWDKDQYKEISE